MILPASAWTSLSQAMEPAERSRALLACWRSCREPHVYANPRTRNWSPAALPSNAPPVGRRLPAIRHGSRIRSRVGRRISSLPCCKRRSIAASMTRSFRSTGAEGILWTGQLAQKEGIFTGISGGSTFAVARRIAEREPAGSVILCMLPDTGERYLSTPLFDSIEADMNEEELALSRSTRVVSWRLSEIPAMQNRPPRAGQSPGRNARPRRLGRCASRRTPRRRRRDRLSARHSRSSGLAGHAL